MPGENHIVNRNHNISINTVILNTLYKVLKLFPCRALIVICVFHCIARMLWRINMAPK